MRVRVGNEACLAGTYQCNTPCMSDCILYYKYQESELCAVHHRQPCPPLSGRSGREKLSRIVRALNNKPSLKHAIAVAYPFIVKIKKKNHRVAPINPAHDLSLDRQLGERSSQDR